MKTQCPACNYPLAYDEKAFGHVGKCESCKARLRIGADGAITTDGLAPRQDTSPQMLRAPQPTPSPYKMISVALIAFLVGGGLGAFLDRAATRNPATTAAPSPSVAQESPRAPQIQQAIPLPAAAPPRVVGKPAPSASDKIAKDEKIREARKYSDESGAFFVQKDYAKAGASMLTAAALAHEGGDAGLEQNYYYQAALCFMLSKNYAACGIYATKAGEMGGELRDKALALVTESELAPCLDDARDKDKEAFDLEGQKKFGESATAFAYAASSYLKGKDSENAQRCYLNAAQESFRAWEPLLVPREPDKSPLAPGETVTDRYHKNLAVMQPATKEQIKAAQWDAWGESFQYAVKAGVIQGPLTEKARAFAAKMQYYDGPPGGDIAYHYTGVGGNGRGKLPWH